MIFFRKAKRIAQLESEKFDLERDLFQAQQLERIASEKLLTWVQKHDELLIKHKALAARFKKLHPRAKIV